MQFKIPVGRDTETGKVTKWKCVQRCTKQTNRNAAEKVAFEIEQAAKAEAGAGDEIGKRLLAILSAATEHANRGTLSEPLARQLMGEIYEVACGQKLESHTIESWFRTWLKRKKAKVKPSTLSLYRLASETFLEWMGDRKGERLETVSRTDIEKYLDHVHEGGRVGKTANQYKKAVFKRLQDSSTIWNFAIQSRRWS